MVVGWLMGMMLCVWSLLDRKREREGQSAISVNENIFFHCIYTRVFNEN